MKHSLAHGSGYLQIDHRASPGLRPEDVAHVPGMVAVGEGKNFEADIQMCTHCQRGVLLNQDRVRPRGYCPKCDHYICDTCEIARVVTGECMPVKKQLDILEKQQTLTEGLGFEPAPLTVSPVPAETPPIILTDAP